MNKCNSPLATELLLATKDRSKQDEVFGCWRYVSHQIDTETKVNATTNVMCDATL